LPSDPIDIKKFSSVSIADHVSQSYTSRVFVSLEIKKKVLQLFAKLVKENPSAYEKHINLARAVFKKSSPKIFDVDCGDSLSTNKKVSDATNSPVARAPSTRYRNRVPAGGPAVDNHTIAPTCEKRNSSRLKANVQSISFIMEEENKKPQHLSKRVTGNKIARASANKCITLKDEIIASSGEEDEGEDEIVEQEEEEEEEEQINEEFKSNKRTRGKAKRGPYKKKAKLITATRKQSADKSEKSINDNALVLKQLKNEIKQEKKIRLKEKKVDEEIISLLKKKLDDYKEDKEEEKALRLKAQKALEIALKAKSTSNDDTIIETEADCDNNSSNYNNRSSRSKQSFDNVSYNNNNNNKSNNNNKNNNNNSEEFHPFRETNKAAVVLMTNNNSNNHATSYNIADNNNETYKTSQGNYQSERQQSQNGPSHYVRQNSNHYEGNNYNGNFDPFKNQNNNNSRGINNSRPPTTPRPPQAAINSNGQIMQQRVMQQYNNSPSYQSSQDFYYTNNNNEIRESDGSCDGYIGQNSNNDVNYHNNKQNVNHYYYQDNGRQSQTQPNQNSQYYQQDNYNNDRRHLMREAPATYPAYDNNRSRNNVVTTHEKNQHYSLERHISHGSDCSSISTGSFIARSSSQNSPANNNFQQQQQYR